MSKRLLPNMDILKKLYLDEKMTCGDICRKYGLSTNSRTNLARMLKKEGIEIRKDKGKNHHNWKGGRVIKGDGYYGIWYPTHPKADKQGYVYEHTLIYEKETKHLIKKNEVLHHIDFDKLNNNFTNLYLFKQNNHIKCHRSIEKLIPPLLDKNIIEFKEGVYILKE